MLTHNQIWTAIDRLAARAKLTPSGLAKKAGLDPTTFNKSKRITPEGRPRWPSTESVAKALAATSTKVDTFVNLITDSGKMAISNVPLKELKRKTGKSVELKSLNAEHRDRTLPMSEVVWVARIVWASQ
jgi:phage repressor protein C with HTH and peptisase S24 domain